MFKPKKPIPLPKLDFTDKKQGFIALSIGIIVALILGGLASGYGWSVAWVYWLLAIGVVVGILNIFHEEGILFLILGLTMTFMLITLTGLPLLALWAKTLFNAVIYLLVPATIVVGLKVLYALTIE